MDSDYGPDRHPTSSNKRVKNLKLLLCVLALGTLFASSAYPQVLAGTILLPDSLGPLTGATHVALDEDPGHPRMFIGGEDGNVLVMSTLTGQRLARIQTGPVKAVCYCPAHNKLYISLRDANAVRVVDCSTYVTVAELQIGRRVSGLLHNPAVDRVYCASTYMPVISCATDSIVDSLHLVGQKIQMALDTQHNWLYVGSTDTFRVADCAADTVIATIPGLESVQAVCYQPTASKVYVAAGWSLAAIDTKTNTIVYDEQYDTLDAQLAIDPSHNRVYYTYYGAMVALDCATDTAVWRKHLPGRAIGLAPDPEHDKLYLLLHAGGNGYPSVLDAATGLILHEFHWSSDSSLYYSAATRRAFLISNGGEVTGFDCAADTIVVATPLTANIADACLDSVDNKLYFSVGRSGVGIVDCADGKVIGYARAPDRLRYLEHNSRDDKLYCSSDSSIFVLDCRTDSFVKAIPIYAWAEDLGWDPTVNKLYVLGNAPTDKVVVIDCQQDSIVKILDLNPSMSWADGMMLMTPEFGLAWVFSNAHWYSVVDCLGDTMVMDTTNRGGNFWSASYSLPDRKVYTAQNRGLYVMSMDTRLPVDSVSVPDAWPRLVHCSPGNARAYWVIENYEGPYVPDSVFAVDTRSDSITGRFGAPSRSFGVCEDRSGDYVYFSGHRRLDVVDARTDSMVSSVAIPVSTQFLDRNSRTNRLYVTGREGDSVIQVVYDSIIFAGVQTRNLAPIQAARVQTVFSRSAPFRSPMRASLFDATGRRAAVLTDGLNDLSRLAPGVYFVRGTCEGADLKPPVVQKVAITR